MIDLYHGQLTDLLQNDLKDNPDVRAISFAIQQEKQRLLRLEAKTRTLSMIDELDANVLDVLAVELRIPYYSQADNVERKRNIVKTAMLWYYKAGTVEGLMTALHSVHGESSAEEWFQYGGDPGYFRVGIDITDPEEALNLNWLTGIVNAYKPVRAHLEDDGIAFRSVQRIEIGVGYGFVAYEAPRAGTRPGPATVGGIGTAGIAIRAAPGIVSYAAPGTGEATAGTHPSNATVGGMLKQSAIVETRADGADYAAPKTGQIAAGTHPNAATEGGILAQLLQVDSASEGVGYAAPRTGTEPNAATAGASGTSGLKTSITAEGTSYSGPVCGGGDFF